MPQKFLEGVSLFCLLLTFSAHSQGKLFQCPEASEIFPCGCQQDLGNNETGYLYCQGELIQQKHIDKLIPAVSSSNGNPIQLHLLSFQITHTNMTQLDLNSLTSCNIQSLTITDCRQLTSILPVNPLSGMELDVLELYVGNTPLTNEEVGNLLNYLNPATSPESFGVTLGQLHKVPKGSLLIPGISSYPKVKYLRLVQNEIEEILSGAFEGLSGLQSLVLSDNRILKIGTHAFSLGEGQGMGQNLTIWLDQDELTDDKIEPEFIPLQSHVSYFLNFRVNSFEYISASNFQNLMFPSGPIRELDMTSQNFICDSKMAWIKFARNELEDKIKGVICTNDPGGLSIFETDLVYPNFSCPGPLEILPCTCRAGSMDDDEEGASLYCDGPLVQTDNDLHQLFSWVRTANGNPVKLTLDTFNVRGTNLTQIDLTPFINCSIRRIFVTDNQQLTTIMLPPVATQRLDVIEGMVLQNNSLTNEALGNLAMAINPITGPQYFSASFNKLGSRHPDSPLISGLSVLDKLESLRLQENEIGAIVMGDFVGFKGLGYLDLSQNNISGIEKGAFGLISGQSITVNLDQNRLTDDKIEPGFISPLEAAMTTYFFTMKNNSFTTLSAKNFENLIYPTGPVTGLDFDGCPFICDANMQWLKAGRSKYENRFHGVICSNDPLGKTIFETDLVSSSFHLIGQFHLVITSMLVLLIIV